MLVKIIKTKRGGYKLNNKEMRRFWKFSELLEAKLIIIIATNELLKYYSKTDSVYNNYYIVTKKCITSFRRNPMWQEILKQKVLYEMLEPLIEEISIFISKDEFNWQGYFEIIKDVSFKSKEEFNTFEFFKLLDYI